MELPYKSLPAFIDLFFLMGKYAVLVFMLPYHGEQVYQGDHSSEIFQALL
jgi:hypothetical protein